MRRLLFCLVGLAAASCGDSSATEGGGGSGAGGEGGAGASTGTGASDARLALAFEPVTYDTQTAYITDMAFVPDGSGRFLTTDLYGAFEFADLGPDGAEVVFSAALDDVYVEYDAGLLGCAIDPDFADNGFIYLALNLAKNHVVVRRYAVDFEDPAATLASETLILTVQVPSSPRWHNITSMGFEESGVMWLLVGDKGVAKPDVPDPTMEVPQDESLQLGALVRILPSKDPEMGGYEPVAGGPTYSPTSDPSVYAKGIRSPWQGVYHEGSWYYGEVGLNDIEEINIIDAPGKNFGWPVVEGPCANDIFENDPDCSLYDDPWVYFNRSASSPFVSEDPLATPTGKRSVYAGWIYQPNENDQYQGRWNDVLVWGDAFVGFMRASELEGDSAGWHLGHMNFPSAWAQGPDGYVYVIRLSEEPEPEGGSSSGKATPLLRAVLAD